MHALIPHLCGDTGPQFIVRLFVFGVTTRSQLEGQSGSIQCLLLAKIIRPNPRLSTLRLGPRQSACFINFNCIVSISIWGHNIKTTSREALMTDRQHCEILQINGRSVRIGTIPMFRSRIASRESLQHATFYALALRRDLHLKGRAMTSLLAPPLLSLALWLSGCGDPCAEQVDQAFLDRAVSADGAIRTESGLIYLENCSIT